MFVVYWGCKREMLGVRSLWEGLAVEMLGCWDSLEALLCQSDEKRRKKQNNRGSFEKNIFNVTQEMSKRTPAQLNDFEFRA